MKRHEIVKACGSLAADDKKVCQHNFSLSSSINCLQNGCVPDIALLNCLNPLGQDGETAAVLPV
jgi:hypothetical protein